jgi:S-formylglutathione hydrolase FrmB
MQVDHQIAAAFFAKHSRQQCQESMLVLLRQQTTSWRCHLQLDLKVKPLAPMLHTENRRVEVPSIPREIPAAVNSSVAWYLGAQILIFPSEETSVAQIFALATSYPTEKAYSAQALAMHENIPAVHNTPLMNQAPMRASHSVSLRYFRKKTRQQHRLKLLRMHMKQCGTRDKAKPGVEEPIVHRTQQQPMVHTFLHSGVIL